MTHQSNDSPQPRGEPDHAALSSALQKLEPTSRHSTHKNSLKSFVCQHYDDLNAAHGKGHTWSALAQIVQAELHVEIASETSRKYMAAIRQEKELEEIDTSMDDSAPSSNGPFTRRSPHQQKKKTDLPQNLLPAIDREFRRSHRSNET